MNRTARFVTAAIAVLALAYSAPAQATSSRLNQFRTAYPAAAGTRLDTCSLCHTSAPAFNAYGSALSSAGVNFRTIESADSDRDGFSNLAEITALTFPGNAADFPATPPPPVADTTLPTVTAFAIPATSTTLAVPITTLTASDNVGVTGYLVSESATKPAAGAAGWTATAPTSFTFPTASVHTLYAYAKDLAGNVSNSRSASVTITLPPPPPVADTTAPSVVSFSIPATSSSLTVAISALGATDNVGVTGFLVSESSTKPAASASGWSANAPSSYTFGTEGAHTLYAFAKDLAGNVSNGLGASVTITIPLPPPPPPPPPPTDPPASGVLFSDTFSDATRYGDPNWQTLAGRFAGVKGKYSALGRRGNLALVKNEIAIDPYLGGRIDTDLQVLDDSSGAAAGFVFDYQDAQHYRFVYLGKNGTITVGEVGAVVSDDDDDDEEDDDVRATAATKRVTASTRRIRLRRTAGGWHHLSVDINSTTGVVNVYVDRATLPAVSKTLSYAGGRVGILTRSRAAFDNFQVQGETVTP